MSDTKRNRPNYWEARHHQWEIAGKIAIATGAIRTVGNNTIEWITPTGRRADEVTIATLKSSSVYGSSSCVVKPYQDDGLHYSMIGQDYLYNLGISIHDLLEDVQ